YNDSWMKDHGYLESRSYATAKDILLKRKATGKLITVNVSDKLGDVIARLSQAGISQIPVKDGDEFVGSISDSKVLKLMIEDPSLRDKQVKDVMEEPFTFVGLDNTIDVLSSLIAEGSNALLLRDEKDEVHILTQSDLLTAIAK